MTITMFFITPTEGGHVHGPECPCGPRLTKTCWCDQDADCPACDGTGDRPLDFPEDGCCLTHNQTGPGPVKWELVRSEAEIEGEPD